MKTLLLFFTLISISVFSQQSIDLLTISGRYGTPQPFVDNEPGKATEISTLTNIKIPIVLSEKIIWYSQLTHVYSNVDMNRTFPSDIMSPISVHGFMFQTGIVKKIDDTRAIQLLIAPRFMTDFNNINGRSIQMGGIALFEKRFKPNLMMRFGVMYNQELSGPLFVPLVHLDWVITDKWSISGLLPIYAKIKYKVNENISTGISFFGLITSYQLGDPHYSGDYMERTSLDLTAFSRVRIAGNLHIEGRVGYAIGRTYAQYEGDQKIDFRISILKFGDNRVVKNIKFEDGMIINLRLVYNMPL